MQLLEMEKTVEDRTVAQAGEANLIYMQVLEDSELIPFSNLHVKRWPGQPMVTVALFSASTLCHADTHLGLQKVKTHTQA